VNQSSNDMALTGPDAANPLGFLCALGTLRVASLVWPDRDIRMGWDRRSTGWRPILSMATAVSEAELVEGIYRYCRYGPDGGESDLDGPPPGAAEAFPYLAIDRNTSKIEPDEFRTHALDQRPQASAEQRVFLDYLAAYGSDAVIDEGVIQDTALRTMSGSGWQHFLETMLNLTEDLELRHIEEALLAPWRYRDPLKNLSMRWDPSDLKQYALQATNPSDDRNRRSGSVHGANRLAVEALPLLPTMPVLRGLSPELATTGFEIAVSQPHWTWPVWGPAVSVSVVASLLAHPHLQRAVTDRERGRAAREELRRMGVRELFRSRRISVDYYRNFTPAEAV
jgi:hypothetical protein